MFQRAFHVQQHQHEAADGLGVGAWPEELQGQAQADDHEEQHGAEALGNDERVDRADLSGADRVGGVLDALAEHTLAPRAVDAQLLGPLGDGVVVLLQPVFRVARRHEAFDATASSDVLDDTADTDCQQHHQEHRQ
ncbi:hypothetical protein D3C76_1043820 [compost metagenome]